MTQDITALIRELKDRQDIHDCLLRYCRGVDRLDRAAIRSAYHDDAIDDHGEYVGGVEGFIDWVCEYHLRSQRRTLHSLSNHLCEIDGDIAHAETYWTFLAVNQQPPFQTTVSGRYIDRLERRDGTWGIVRRLCVLNGLGAALDPEGIAGDAVFAPSFRDKDDSVYMRPLELDPGRLTKTIG